MNNNFSQDLGENYEYAKVIIRNKIELAKLDLIENSAEIGAGLILASLLGFLMFMIIICLMIVLGVWLTNTLGSVSLACTCIALVFIMFMLLLFTFRKTLIINPFINFFYKKYIKN